MRQVFIEMLCDLAEDNEDLYLIVADLGYSVVEPFAEKFADRFINVGICEQNAIGVAAGLALTGKSVFVYSIVPFVTMRCFEQLRIDVSYQNLSVFIVGVGSGVMYGPAGPTHHAYEDIAIIRMLPNFEIHTPCNRASVQKSVSEIVDRKGPAYLRLGREYQVLSSNYNLTNSNRDIWSECDILVITLGTSLDIAYEYVVPKLEKCNYQSGVIVLNKVWPIEDEILQKIVRFQGPIITVEDHFGHGGLRTILIEYLIVKGFDVSKVNGVNLGVSYTHKIGSSKYLTEHLLGPSLDGLDTYLKYLSDM